VNIATFMDCGKLENKHKAKSAAQAADMTDILGGSDEF
jgi:hypothetical protein